MGRPRSFDVNVALDQALQVFWKKGYEGASLTDLTEAMGINRPSLYCAFGSKEELFRKALDRYAAGPASYVCRALEEPTRQIVRNLAVGQHSGSIGREPDEVGAAPAVDGHEGREHRGDEHGAKRVRFAFLPALGIVIAARIADGAAQRPAHAN